METECPVCQPDDICHCEPAYQPEELLPVATWPEGSTEYLQRRFWPEGDK